MSKFETVTVTEDEYTGWRKRVESLEDVLLALVNRASDAGKDDGGQDMVKLRRALLERAEATLGFRVCEHCGKRDRSVGADRFDNVPCTPCAEREAVAEYAE